MSYFIPLLSLLVQSVLCAMLFVSTATEFSLYECPLVLIHNLLAKLFGLSVMDEGSGMIYVALPGISPPLLRVYTKEPTLFGH